MNTKILTGALALALAVAAPYSSQAKKAEMHAPAQAMASPSQHAKAERPLPFIGKVGKIDLQGKRVTLATKQGLGRTFVITDRTVITKAGNPGKISDLYAQEVIRGSYWQRPDGTLEAKSLKIGPPTVAEKEQFKAKVRGKAHQLQQQHQQQQLKSSSQQKY